MPVHYSKRVYNPERRAFRNHKSGAKKRGIEFKFTFDEWIDWWGADFDNRGSHYGGLCMARYNDEGAYEPDNVYKATMTENCSGPRQKECRSNLRETA
jgi:hypothetical protein